MRGVMLLLCVLLTAQMRSPLAAAQTLGDFRVLKSIPIAANPHGIAFSPDGTRVFVVSSAGQALTVLSSMTDTIEKIFPLADTPLGIVLTPDGQHAAISHFGADRISRIDLRTGAIDKTLRVGGRPSLFAPTRDGRRAFISCETANRVFEIDLEAFMVVREFETGKRPFPPALSRDSRWLFVPAYDAGEVTIIDLVAGARVADVKVGVHPSGGTALPTGQGYVVANRGSNSLSVIDPATKAVQRLLQAGLEQEPFSIVLSPDGRLGFVNHTGSASVAVLDIERFAVVGRIPVGRQPIVMAVHPAGRKLYVSCEGSHELTVVGLPKG